MGERDFERSDDGRARSAVGGRSSTDFEPSKAERPGSAASRRRFMQLVGGAGGAMALSTLLAACGGEEQQQAAEGEGASVQLGSDLEIVNYALYLEYLEEDFYEQVVASGRLRPEYQALAKQFRQDESEHVDVLEKLVGQLGGAPVPRPNLKLGAVIAGGEQRIIETAAMVENLGAAAYLGQAPNIENNFTLEAALAIHTVEARHAAALNEIAGNGFRGDGRLTGSIPDGAFADPMTREQVLEAAAPYVRA